MAKAKPKAAPVMGELKSFYDRVSRMEDDREALSADTKELTKEINGAGYNAKAIKRMVKESRKKTDEQLEADLELYRSVLAMPGATYRSAAEQLKVPRSTLHRLVPKRANGTEPPHDSDGLILDTQGEGGDAAGRDAIPGLGVADRSTSDCSDEYQLPALGDSAVVPLGCNTHPQPEHHTTEAPLCSCEKCVDLRIAALQASGAPFEQTCPGPTFPGWSYGCEKCGNKRCPHHTDHALACTNSNEPGQPGSSYHRIEAQPSQELGAVAASAPRVATDYTDAACMERLEAAQADFLKLTREVRV